VLANMSTTERREELSSKKRAVLKKKIKKKRDLSVLTKLHGMLPFLDLYETKMYLFFALV